MGMAFLSTQKISSVMADGEFIPGQHKPSHEMQALCNEDTYP